MKEFTVTKNSVMEIQNLVTNLKSELVKSNCKQHQFLFAYVSCKNQYTKFVKLTKKTLACGHFCARGISPKALAKYNCSGPPAFRCQRYRVEKNITPSLSAYKNHSIYLLNSSNHLWDTPGLWVPWSIRPHPFLTMPTQKLLSF